MTAYRTAILFSLSCQYSISFSLSLFREYKKTYYWNCWMNIVLQWYYRYTGSRACCCGCVVVEGFIRGFWFFHLVHASGANLNLSRYLQIESRVEAVPAVQRPKVRACNRTGPVMFCDHGDPVLVHVHRVNTAIDITNSDCRENDTKESTTCNISIIIN